MTGRRHLWIPDTQVKPSAPIDHFTWIGRAIIRYQPDVIIHGGDHWDMESLSAYDRNSPRKMEKRRLKDDISRGNQAMTELWAPLKAYNRRRDSKHQYNPRRVFLFGNHEDRLSRRIDEMPQELDGLISFDLLNLGMWETHEFRKVVKIDGIHYSHFFYNPNSGRPYGGMAITKLKNIGLSFTMGHQQGMDYAMRHLVDGRMQYGLVAGSCYLHDEEYRGPQANGEWRGIVVKNDVRDGSYDIMPLSLKYLKQQFA